MLDLAGKPPTPQKPDVELASINQPSRANEILAVLVILSVGLATLMVFFLDRAEAKKLAQLDEQYASLTRELQSGTYLETATTATQVSQGLAVLRESGKAGLAWSALFKIFQGITTNGVVLVSLSIDSRNLMKIEGHAQSYVQLAHFLATLRTAPTFKRVDLLSASLVESLQGQRVNFGLELELDPAKSGGGA